MLQARLSHLNCIIQCCAKGVIMHGMQQAVFTGIADKLCAPVRSHLVIEFAAPFAGQLSSPGPAVLAVACFLVGLQIHEQSRSPEWIFPRTSKCELPVPGHCPASCTSTTSCGICQPTNQRSALLPYRVTSRPHRVALVDEGVSVTVYKHARDLDEVPRRFTFAPAALPGSAVECCQPTAHSQG